MLAQVLDPWRYQWHPEVWVLVAFLTGAYIYMVRVIGPKAVAPGQAVVTRFNIGCFIGAMLMLWVASDWPIHDIGEEYLYSAHMLQHMMLSYFLPPLVLMATPQWLLRVLVGDGKLYRGLAFMCKPVIAAVVFNAIVIITHIPGVVTASVDNGPLHYSLHFAVVMSSLLMWMPVVGPFPELQISALGKCIYLFMQSLVPTIPAAWLTFADGAVYKTYDQPVRVWGMSVQHDQQLAGAIMKTGGGIFLWTIIIFLFFRRFAADYGTENANSYRRDRSIPAAELTGDAHTDGSTPLTTADIEREFAKVPAAPDGRTS
ncbi:MAG TPA: cytochrome c oxidase assembly protein [Ilumatobacteraceae bacterium]|nr:cytochrome c oxidase assembly protein [Ilumatobacteraceae bacterium]